MDQQVGAGHQGGEECGAAHYWRPWLVCEHRGGQTELETEYAGQVHAGMVPGLVPGSHPPALTSCHWDHHHKTDLLPPGASWHPTLSLSLSLSLSAGASWSHSPTSWAALCEEISQILGGTEVKQHSTVSYAPWSSYFHLGSVLTRTRYPVLPISTTALGFALDQMCGGEVETGGLVSANNSY